jgi:K+-transporting ATPase ATPase C chain
MSMLTEIRAALRPALSLLLAATLLTGLCYPLLVTLIAQLVLPHQANGSLIEEGGRVIGSERIAQGFAGRGWFHPRPSAAGTGYDASASSASNLAPGSKVLAATIAARIAALHAEGISGAAVPADLVTASASGLDPDLSPAAALMQIPRIAAARGLPEAKVRALVEAATQWPLLGVIGEPHVNVLALNRQLAAIGAKPAR